MKPAKAVPDWDRAIELSPPAEQLVCRASRATSRLRAGLIAEALAEIAELTKSGAVDADQWYDFACVYAVAGSKSADKKHAYAERAMELLHKAVQAGYKDATHMQQDTDLDLLRERDDFQQLLDSLQATHVPQAPR